jgi:predicted nucleotidyltransferase
VHHYVGIAKGAMETMVESEIKIKKLFYVLRPLLAAKWCLVKNSIAPMRIGPLMELLPESMRDEINELIILKAGKNEAFPIRMSNELKSYIESEFELYNNVTFELTKNHFSIEMLDIFFRKIVARREIIN